MGLSPEALIACMAHNHQRTSSAFPPMDRKALLDAVMDTHQKLADGAYHVDTELVEDLLAGRPIVRFAYQPKLFPYVNIIAQLIYLDECRDSALAKHCSVVPMMFIVDHDDSSEQYIRKAQVWDPNVHGHLRAVRTSGQPGCDGQLLWLAPSPSVEERARVTAEVAEYTGDEEFGRRLLAATAPATCLAEFNLASFSWVVQQLLGVRVLFCSLSTLRSRLGPVWDHVSAVLTTKLGYGSGPPLFWGWCPHCGQRLPIAFVSDAAIARCEYCGWERSVPKDAFLQQPHAAMEGQVIPKVLVDDLTDYVGLGASGGTTYLSGREHVRASQEALRRIGESVRPESCWRMDLYGSFGPERYYAHRYPDGHFPQGILPAIKATVTGRLSYICYWRDDPGLHRLGAAIRQSLRTMSSSLVDVCVKSTAQDAAALAFATLRMSAESSRARPD